MSLETYTGYIPSLVVTNPTATDPKNQGDDHLRGVKRTLAVTFSGFTEPDVAVTVKASQINSAVQDGLSFVPAGAINIWPAAAAPAGWLLSQGQAVSRTTYAKLFAVIGTTYGPGNGSTTFNLPDLRGYFVRGLDAGRGVDTGRVLGSGQAGDNAPHNHSGTTSGGALTATPAQRAALDLTLTTRKRRRASLTAELTLATPSTPQRTTTHW